MTKNRILATVAISLTLSFGPRLASAGDFLPYEGKDAVQEGTGGTKKTVDGIDFWSNGAPPKKFQILGFIEDTRLKSGLFGMIRMAGLESSIAKTAKTAGGDAVILGESGVETVGFVGQNNQTVHATASGSGNTTYIQGSTSGTSSSKAVQDQHSKYVVVRYLPENAPVGTASESGDPLPQVKLPSQDAAPASPSESSP